MRVSRAQSEYWIPARRICGSRAEKIDQIESAIQELLDIKLLESIDAQPNLRFLAVPRRSHWFGMTLTILVLLIVLVLLLGTRQAHAQSCHGGNTSAPSQNFLGFMAYHRAWFDRNRLALTVGGGAIRNPGRYLVLLPPINGATASTGTPYFTTNPGRRLCRVGCADDI